MKTLLSGTVLAALLTVAPIQSMAGVTVSFGISLPPPIAFVAPPEVVVIPETYVYAAPDVDVNLFFYDGFWWRLWEGRWYRSSYYNSGWSYYEGVPDFYALVPHNWRIEYREHLWNGHPWTYQRVTYHDLRRGWRDWEKNDHWVAPAVQPQHQVRPQQQTVTSHVQGPARIEQSRPQFRQTQSHETQSREVRPHQQSRPQPQSMNSYTRQGPNSQQPGSQQARSERGNGQRHGRT
jgi:hypothetical protein